MKLTELSDTKQQLLELIELFDHKKHSLQNKPALGRTNVVFADVVLLGMEQQDPTEGRWIARRIVRTTIPQVFDWLFRQFAQILFQAPGYGRHKEEIFGRLGNTISIVEASTPPLSDDEKVAAVLTDFWEICQDLYEGKLVSLDVAIGATIHDDFIERAVKSGFLSQAEFERQLFGGVH